MKKMFFVTFMLLLSFILCFPIPKPKNDNVGAIIGKIYIETDKDWNTMKAGKYYKVQVNLINNETKKEVFTLANKDGYYYFLNLKPGEYVLKSYKYQIRSGNWIYTLWSNFGEKGIILNIDSNKIDAVKTIFFKIVIGGDQKMGREENLDELKDFFTNLDKKSQWANFEWDYEGKKIK